MDGNNQILPVGYGIGKSEDGESWTWFLSKLKECIGEHPDLAIISDRANSIDLAVRTVFPNAFHGLCCRHLMVNLKIPKSKKKDLETLWWNTCKAYRVSDFEESFNALCAALPRVRNTLLSIGLHKWSRAHCSGKRYHYMTSNSAESMNALSKDERKVPITHLVEFFRQKLQQWYYERRNEAIQNKHVLTPFAVQKIIKKIEYSRTWKAYGVGVNTFQVLDGDKNGFVDLSNETCSCCVPQISGFPCGHMIAVSKLLKEQDCSHYTSPWYSNQLYKTTYEEAIYPLPHRSEWETPEYLIPLQPPHITKRQSGRPRENKRILSRGEEPTPVYCSRCRTHGHHRDRCSAPVASRSKSARRGSKKENHHQTPSPTFVEADDFAEYVIHNTCSTVNLADF